MSGEFATSEWRVAVLSLGLVSLFAVSAVLHALHSLFHLPYDISICFSSISLLEPPQNPVVRKSLRLRVCVMNSLGCTTWQVPFQ